MNTTQSSRGAAPSHVRVGWLCAIVLVLEGYDIAAAGYAVPALVDAWRAPPAAFTQALAAGNIGIVLGSLIGGPLGDRLGRRPVLVGCVVLFGVFSLLSMLAASPSQLAALRLGTGLGLGGGLPMAIALASDFAPTAASGRFVMMTTLGVPIGFAGGGLLASQLLHVFGWPAIFAVGGVAPLVFAPLIVILLSDSSAFQVGARNRGSVASLFSDGRAASTLLIWAIGWLSTLTSYLVLLWTPAILHDAGAKPSRAAVATSLYALGLVGGILAMARIVDRFGMKRVLTFGLALGAFGAFATGSLGAPLWALSALIFVAGLGGGSQAGINALSGLIYPARMRATGAGWALGVARLGAIAGPLLGGLMLARGYQGNNIFVAAAVAMASAAVLMTALGRVQSMTQCSQRPGRPTVVVGASYDDKQGATPQG
jgi:AAHS family 4-hydroxybenzoate transporter-like MFS transporter